MYYVYVLKSLKDGNIYTGYTANLEKRYKRHCDGLVISTKDRRPLVLVYFETFLSSADAHQEELYLKSGGHAKNVLKLRIKNSLDSAIITKQSGY